MFFCLEKDGWLFFFQDVSLKVPCRAFLGGAVMRDVGTMTQMGWHSIMAADDPKMIQNKVFSFHFHSRAISWFQSSMMWLMTRYHPFSGMDLRVSYRWNHQSFASQKNGKRPKFTPVPFNFGMNIPVNHLGLMVLPPWKLTLENPSFSIGNTCSNGGCSIVMLVFAGLRLVDFSNMQPLLRQVLQLITCHFGTKPTTND